VVGEPGVGEARLLPDLEYTFKHALTHEVAYGSLLQERRRELHAAIVTAMEVLHAGRLGEQVEVLAHQAQRAELWDKAARYLRQAAAKAVARSAYREGIELFEQALGALARRSESEETLRRQGVARRALRLSRAERSRDWSRPRGTSRSKPGPPTCPAGSAPGSQPPASLRSSQTLPTPTARGRRP
jgi:predicted ATPase